jgi:nucleotidyltransferase/DNA polymerase involved in DNA repair
METCVETAASPSAGPTPAWAIRVARSVGDGIRMAERLRGVPKPMLQTIFGNALGRRIWQQARVENTQPAARAADQVADAEISSAMVDYLCQQAADSLRKRSRQAKAITLTVTYTDGAARVARARLLRPTSNGDEIAEAATALLRRFSDCGVRSVDLTVTSVKTTSVEQTTRLVYSMATT